MVYEECIRLVPFLKGVPDVRQARGKQYELWVLLTILCVAILSGQKTIWGIVEWALAHTGELVRYLDLPRGRVPSRSTFYVTLRRLGVEGLERKIAEMGTAMERENRLSESLVGADGAPLRGMAVDGKDLRGARAHGNQTFLVSLVGHGDGIVLGQEAVDVKTNEITVVPKLLAERDLRGVVITMDALLAQRALASQITDAQGDYLMVVKRNQSQLWQDIDLFFQARRLNRGEAKRDTVVTNSQSHGRKERRTLEASPELSAYLTWPGSAQVMRRTYHAVDLCTGEITHEVVYGITSLPPQRAKAKQLAELWRSHWTIENRTHYVRDETLGEDRCQLHTGHSAQALAALRNAVLNVLRYEGWSNVPSAIRRYGASVHHTMQLLGAIAS